MKIALFYRVWFDTGEKFLNAAKKKGVELVPIQYDDLVLRQKGNDFEILYQEEMLVNFDLFYFRAVGSADEWASLLLQYAKKKQIPVVDEYLTDLGLEKRAKSVGGVILAKNKVNYPRTSFASNKDVLLTEAKKFQYPFVLKISRGGRQGMGTLLIKDEKVLARAIKGRIEKSGFLLQEYIPNDGDYRLMLIGYQVLGAFKRQKKEEKLVLNRSLGSSEKLKTVPEAVKKEAEKACRVLKVEIASVDMVIDERDGRPVIVEVNEAPQFSVFERRTGINAAEKIIEYLVKKAKK